MKPLLKTTIKTDDTEIMVLRDHWNLHNANLPQIIYKYIGACPKYFKRDQSLVMDGLVLAAVEEVSGRVGIYLDEYLVIA